MSKKVDVKETEMDADKGVSANKHGQRKNKKYRPNTKRKNVREVGGSPRFNDVNWYVPSDRLLRDSSSLSYNNPLGNSLRLTELSDFSMGGSYNNRTRLDTAIPGIMVIHSGPGVGFSNSNYSPISLAAKSLYARVRKDNAGAKNYDPADLIKYIIALDSAICMYGFFSRVYGCMQLYSAYNRYWPKAVVEACNVDFQDVLANLADFRYYLNSYALKINSLYMPTCMNIVPRHFFMYSGIWKDSDVDKCQLFVHVPDWIYEYDEFTTPSSLMPLHLADKINMPKLTFSTIVSYMDTTANALLVSEDIGIISGDLMKAFGADAGFKLQELPVDYMVSPVYDEHVLAQIQATKFTGRLNNVNITESTAQDDTLGCILCTPYNTDPRALPNIAHPINYYKNEVTPEDTMEASRLMAFGSRVVADDGSGTWVATNTFDVVGSEFPLYFEMMYTNAGVPSWFTAPLSGVQEFLNYVLLGSDISSGSAGSAARDMAEIDGAISNFDHAPLISTIRYDAATGATEFYNRWAHFDYSNYTFVNRPMVRKMHETAFLSLFGIDTLTNL